MNLLDGLDRVQKHTKQWEYLLQKHRGKNKLDLSEEPNSEAQWVNGLGRHEVREGVRAGHVVLWF